MCNICTRCILESEADERIIIRPGDPTGIIYTVSLNNNIIIIL